MRLKCNFYKLRAALFALVFILSAAAASADSAYFSPVWTRNVPALRDLSISPKGERLAMLTSDNRVSVWDVKTAKPLWSKSHQFGSSVKISDGAGYAFVYALMNPMERAIKFYSSENGDLIASYLSNKPVWDVEISDDGDYMAAGDSGGNLAIYRMLKRPSRIMVRLRGGCDKLAFAPDGSFLAAGVWNSSGIDLYTPEGALIASEPGILSRRFQPIISRDSDFALGLQYDNHQEQSPSLTLWNRRGQQLWTYTLGKYCSMPRALIAKQAKFTVLFYYEQIMRNRAWTPERRLLVIGRNGKPKFKIGGLYLSLSLMTLSPDNNGFVAYDGDQKLYRFDQNGSALETYQLSAPIRDWSCSADNRILLLHTIDNRLSLIRVR